MAKDLNAPSISPLLRALVLSSGQGPVPTSSLHTLAVVISCIGPLIPPPLAPSILQIPMTGLTPHVSADVALPKLRLLLACMGSGNTHLCPPTSATVQVLTDLSNHHASREVGVSFVCTCVLLLLRHLFFFFRSLIFACQHYPSSL